LAQKKKYAVTVTESVYMLLKKFCYERGMKLYAICDIAIKEYIEQKTAQADG
jgi:hypothetical protein